MTIKELFGIVFFAAVILKVAIAFPNTFKMLDQAEGTCCSEFTCEFKRAASGPLILVGIVRKLPYCGHSRIYNLSVFEFPITALGGLLGVFVGVLEIIAMMIILIFARFYFFEERDFTL